MIHSARTMQLDDFTFGVLSGMDSVGERQEKAMLPMERRETLRRSVGKEVETTVTPFPSFEMGILISRKAEENMT
jgi:hypothetical protein